MTFKKSSKKKRVSSLLSSSEVLDSLFQKKRGSLSSQFKRWKLWNHWREVVGDEMSLHSDPVNYQKGRLYVAVSDSVRLQEISFFESLIREKINHFIGHEWVKSIRFTLDRRDVPPSSGFNPHYQKWKDFFRTKALS